MSHRWALYLSLNLLASSAIGCAVVDSRNSRFTVANTTTPLTLTGYSDTPNMPLYLAYYVGTNPSVPE